MQKYVKSIELLFSNFHNLVKLEYRTPYSLHLDTSIHYVRDKLWKIYGKKKTQIQTRTNMK